MERIPFKDIDFSWEDDFISLGWDTTDGYSITIWEKPLGSKNNNPKAYSVLPKPLGLAISKFLGNKVNDLM